jgi:hypothetical protein
MVLIGTIRKHAEDRSHPPSRSSDRSSDRNPANSG